MNGTLSCWRASHCDTLQWSDSALAADRHLPIVSTLALALALVQTRRRCHYHGCEQLRRNLLDRLAHLFIPAEDEDDGRADPSTE